MRKVQVVGNSTYVVSLPKNWVKMMGLKQGEEVLIEPLADGSLRVTPLKGVKDRHASVSINVACSEDVAVITRRVVAHYLAGACEVSLKLEGSDCGGLAKVVARVARDKMLGVEVLDEAEDSLTLYAVLDREFTDFITVVRKLFKAAAFMAEALVAGLEEGREDVLRNVFKRDDIVDKLYLFILRYLTESLMTLKGDLGFTPPEALHIVLMSKSVERLADHIASIALNSITLKGRDGLGILKPVMPLLKDVPNLLKELTEAFTKCDAGKAEEALLHAKEGKRRERDVRGKILKGGSPPELSYVLESVRRIYAYAVDIAEAVIDIAAIRSLREFRTSG